MLSTICRDTANNTCEICGRKKGDLYHGKPQRVETHHVMSRSNKGSPLQYDLRNCICLCSLCHKSSRKSAHKHGLWFAKEFNRLRPDDAQWILDHTDDTIDMFDREVLKIVENCLDKNLPLDLKQYGVTYINN